jgi:hypothetical protein
MKGPEISGPLGRNANQTGPATDTSAKESAAREPVLGRLWTSNGHLKPDLRIFLQQANNNQDSNTGVNGINIIELI